MVRPVNNVDNAALGIRTLSPVPSAQDERYSDVNSSDHEGEEEDFPSRLTCLIYYEPPVVAVFFDIPDTNGGANNGGDCNGNSTAQPGANNGESVNGNSTAQSRANNGHNGNGNSTA